MTTLRAAAAALALTAAATLPPSANAQPTGPNPDTYVGHPTARDADTLSFTGGWRVFLYGIESVEPGQVCFIDGVMWACYFAALRSLETIIGTDEVTCNLVSPPDYLGRRLGNCFVGGMNIAEAQVRAGFALAKRDETLDYVDEEDLAKAEKIGLWQGEFQPPAEFRKVEGNMPDRP